MSGLPSQERTPWARPTEVRVCRALTGAKQHGDLRIPHFTGMHALQIIPLIVWLARRRRTVRFVFSISASYFVLYLILLWQALRGESIADP